LAQSLPALCTQCHEEETLRSVPHHQKTAYQACLDCHAGHGGVHPKLLKEVFFKTIAGLDYLHTHSELRPRPLWADAAQSLRGREAIVLRVMVKPKRELEALGITEAWSRTRMEQSLQRFDVGIVSPQGRKTTHPELALTLSLLALPSHPRSSIKDVLCGSIEICLQQPVHLLPHTAREKGALCTAITWHKAGIVRWTTAQARAGFDQAIQVLVQAFGQDYAQVNATPAGNTPQSQE
jgi:predicted CXXCH cytochrome family protein